MPDLDPLPDLGYDFSPHPGPEHPGYQGLVVTIRARPTHEHFDPEKAQFPVASSAGAIEHLTVVHPWRLGSDYRATTGRIILADRLNKVVEAFSFGGELRISVNGQATVCRLASLAPIFPLSAVDSLATWIVSEVEVVLARRRACINPHDLHSFTAHLAAADPLLVYTCCLQAIHERLAARPSNGAGDLDRRRRRFVRNEIRRLQDAGLWPDHLPTPAELFA